MRSILRHILCTVIWILIGSGVQAQSLKIDSLFLELAKHPKQNKERVDLLNSIAYEQYRKDQQALKRHAEEAKHISTKINYEQGEAQSQYLLSLYFLSASHLDSARFLINQSLKTFTKLNDKLGQATCFDVLGTLDRFNENFDHAMGQYAKALRLANECGNQVKAADIISNMGTIYAITGELDKATATYKQAIQIYDSLDLSDKALSSYNNLALTFTRQGRNTEAISYFHKCLVGYRALGNKISLAATLQNMGLVYTNLGELKKAIPFIEESLKLNLELGNQIEIAKNYASLGGIHHKQSEFDKALVYYNQSLTINRNLDNQTGLYGSYTNIGSIHLDKKEFNQALTYFKKGLSISKSLGAKRMIGDGLIAVGAAFYELEQYDSAMVYLHQGLKIADELSLLVSQMKANYLLSQIHEKRGNYKDALQLFKLLKSQNDSFMNTENIAAITRLEDDFKYQQERDSARYREQLLSKKIHSTSKDLAKSIRNNFIAAIIVLLSLMVLGAILFIQKLKNEKTKTQKIRLEQKLLRSQMTPHFMFNSLAVLQGMILKKEDLANSYLSRLSKLLRITLENSRHETVSLSREIEAIDNYIALQNLDVLPPYNYHLSVDIDLDTDAIGIPPMIIQPFIENAIEHAFVSSSEDKKIDVHISFKQEILTCIISDNGVGIDFTKQNVKKDKKSLATIITSERLAVLSKDFNKKGSVTIENRNKYSEQGTLVTLVLPYKIISKK